MYDLLLYFTHKQLDGYFVAEKCSCHL